MAAEGSSVLLACRVLAVSESGYYAQHDRPLSARTIRHALLTELIRRVTSRAGAAIGLVGSTPNSSWARASSSVGVRSSCSCAGPGIAGASGRPQFRRIPNVATASDLVERRFGYD